MTTELPYQETADFKKPEEHFSWALRNMPSFAGTGAVTHPGFLTTWSKHLWECGFAHRDYLVGLADADGNINVSQLPKQIIRFQKPFRGPRHGYNNAARWVPVGTVDAPPMQLQDMSKLTLQEQHFQAEQLRELGVIPADKPPHHTAEELNDGY
jgi:hypothetical protein